MKPGAQSRKLFEPKTPGFHAGRWRVQVTLLAGLLALFMEMDAGFGDGQALSKYQVEAVFLFNFAKYVEWPGSTFPDTAAPITIGVLGTDPFGDNLQHAVDGKTINGRRCAIKHLDSGSELAGCQILFISDSVGSDVGGILEKSGKLPILTVGEGDVFARNGGIVNFVLKNGNVRLEIDLAAAKKSGLTISSKLLAVADVVKGKTN